MSYITHRFIINHDISSERLFTNSFYIRNRTEPDQFFFTDLQRKTILGISENKQLPFHHSLKKSDRESEW